MKRTEEWHELASGELPKLMADKLERFELPQPKKRSGG